MTLQLSTRTVAWLADRPRARELVGSVWDTLTDLERAGHHPGAIAAVRFVLVHHQPPTPPADALTAASPGAACGAADPGRAWSGGKSTTSCSAHSPAALTTGNNRKIVAGLGAQRDVGAATRQHALGRWREDSKRMRSTCGPSRRKGSHTRRTGSRSLAVVSPTISASGCAEPARRINSTDQRPQRISNT